MNIYAIRDRLIDYYMNPFAGPGDKEVLAAISLQINGETNSAISQAPHHFEIWRLGKVEEDGHLTAQKELLADCSTLFRGNLRETGKPGGTPLQGPKIESTAPPS